MKIVILLIPLAAIMGLIFTVMSLGTEARRRKGEVIQSQLKVEELSSKNQELVTRLQGLTAEQEEVDTRIDSLRGQLKASTIQLEEARDELETLRWRFERVSESKAALETRVFELSQERDASQRRAAQIESSKVDLERSLVRLRERLKFMDRDYQRMALETAELERQQTWSEYGAVSDTAQAGGRRAGSVAGPVEPVASSRAADRPRGSTIELPPIIVRKDQAGTTTPLQGRLVEVNEPYQFIVVDKGSVDGVRIGMTFDIVRGAGTVIGQATVVRVRPQLAACDVVRMRISESLHVGDVAVESAR